MKPQIVGNSRLFLSEIRRQFPAYADLVNPPLPTLAAVLRTLDPHESLVTVYTTEARTYVWAFRAGVAPAFAIVPVGRAQLRQRVERLRRPMSSPVPVPAGAAANNRTSRCGEAILMPLTWKAFQMAILSADIKLP